MVVLAHPCEVESMEREFLQRPVWDQLTESEAVTVANTLAHSLPKPWRFDALRYHTMGDQRRHVAFFRWRKDRFALIPGDEATLGYDPKDPFVPSAAQREEWVHTEEEYDCTLRKYLSSYLTPLRQVVFEPFLLDVRFREAALEKGHGFRLPTFDEWEYACSGGARTLFRWGDDCPVERYPCQQKGRRGAGWTFHRRPNAFGLVMPCDGYEMEACLKPGRKNDRVVMRGGDGGSSTCGGVGFLAGWLTLATAFYDSYQCEDRDLKAAFKDYRPCPAPAAMAEDFEGKHRRAFSLPPDCLD
jgi:hypothetical protein